MRVVHLMQSSEKVYGAERCILLELGALRRRGHDARVVLLHETRMGEAAWVLPRALWQEGIPVELVQAPRQISLQTLSGLYRVLRALAPQLVQSHSMKTDVLGLLVSRCLRLPFVVEVHGWLRPEHDRRVRAYEALDRLVLRLCEGVIVLSRAYKEEITALGVSQHRVHLLPSGIDVEGLRSQPRTRDLRAELQIPPNALVVGIVARLSPEKGHKDFLQALRYARERWSPAAQAPIGLIVGDGPLLTELQAEAVRLGLGSGVYFAGYVPEVADAYRAMDLVLSCSLYEGLPLNLIEAMSLERPVVAMATGGCVDIVDDGVTGLLSPRGDRVTLGEHLLRLLLDAALRERMGTAALHRARERYSLAAWAQGAEAVYDAVLQGRSVL